MKKCKKHLYYIPHLVVAIIMLMAATGKLSGSAMSVDLFNQLNLFGLGGDESRVLLGMLQLVLTVSLFNKGTEKIAAILIAINMIGAFILVGFHLQAIIVLILALLIIKKSCGCCKKACNKTCDSEANMCGASAESSEEM
jgi:hypothetical protein